MKIDFLINKMSGGGAERVVSLLANHLSKKGLEIRIITFTGSDNYELEPEIKRIKLHNHPLFHSVVVNGFFSLLSFYRKKENRPDIMSSHITLLSFCTIPIAKIFNIKIIISEHINHSYSNNLIKRILREKIYRFADLITVLTSYDVPYFRKNHKNVQLLPNPCTFVRVEEYEITSRPKNKTKVILAIGDLNRYHHKGFDNLIEIAEKVLPDLKDWKLKIVGGGDEGLEKLSQIVHDKGLEEQIIFTGFRSDIRELLKQSEIFILPSRFEGLPMTLLEAMSQGVCCIAYDCISGPSDIISHKENGWLVENQNISEMANSLEHLMLNTSLRKKLAIEAPNALNKFDINLIGDQWLAHFENLLNSK
ncbi:glycosyltransferase family 4 protein [Euzebyella saccharophila]|uniref:Glycosyltransferase family 4 protein n=1 Tax=Euzebyella saccharophila TaxID=679664 RepID=A0ABV8JTS0_9FLAO|nr:glycosyltransferase family 4 protein [Euzebyella saccharophila]